MTAAPNADPELKPGTGPGMPVPRIDSRVLLAGAREVVIVHGGEEYRLRLTRQGKLILTK